MALQKGTIEIPLASGTDQSADDMSVVAPTAVETRNLVHDKGGVLKKRRGSTALALTTSTGGSLTAADLRKFATRDNELVVFTKNALYSWIDNDSEWVKRANYYAVKNDEKVVANKTSQQIDGNCATLANTTLYAWSEKIGSGNEEVRVTLVDNATGSHIQSDYYVADGQRPRVFAFAAYYVLLFNDLTSPDVIIKALLIDPDDSTTDLADTPTTVGQVNQDAVNSENPWDACKVEGSDSIWVAWSDDGAVGAAADYVIRNVQESAGAPSLGTALAKAFDADESIAITHNSEADQLCVVRFDAATNEVLADQHHSITGATVFSGDVLGSSITGRVDNITAVWKDSQDSSQYRCYAFWHYRFNGVSYNYVDDNSAVGTETKISDNVNLTNKAFLYDGTPCVGIGFSEAANATSGTLVRAIPQSGAFLWHLTDGLIGQACHGDYLGRDINHRSFLPEMNEVSSTNFVGCIGFRRRFIGNTSEYAEAGIREVSWTFDSDDARRTVQVGKSLYISGSLPMMYDSRSLVEVGFVVYPWDLEPNFSATGGNLSVSKYFYKAYYEAINAQGERTISSSVALVEADMTGATTPIADDINMFTHGLTRRRGDVENFGIALYRSESNPSASSVLYRVSAHDPSATGNNGFMVNAPTSDEISTFADNYSDDTLRTKEIDYTASGELDNIAPPPCTVIAHGQGRVWLAGLENPNLLWYSKYRADGGTVEFNDSLTIEMPNTGGAVTGIGFLNESVVIFKETATYVLTGYGPDNLGNGIYSEPQLLNDSVGCSSQDLIAETPVGLMFMSRQGVYMVDRGYQLQFIGQQVEDETFSTYVDVVSEPDSQRVRWLSNAASQRSLVYDYGENAWDIWQIGGQGSVIYDNIIYWVKDTGSVKSLVKDDSTVWADSGTDYTIYYESGWIRLSSKWDHHRLRRLFLLGRYRGTHNLRIRIAYDGDPTWVDDFTWTVTPTDANEAERVRIRPSIQKCSSIKIDIQDVDTGGGLDNSLDLISLLLEVAYKRGLSRLPATQGT